MSPEIAARFDSEFAPRIAATIVAFLDPGVRVDVLPYGGHGHPTRVKIHAVPVDNLRRYPYALELSLTWDSDEIERLMHDGSEARFARYLAAIPRKLDAWRGARDIDFRSCTQAEPSMLIGGLDFEA